MLASSRPPLGEFDTLHYSTAALGFACMLMVTGNARAQTAGGAEACARITADAARLACYDAAFGRAEAAPVEAEKFGDDGQLRPKPKSKPELPKSLSGQVAQLTPLPNGLYRLTLDNQQVWQTTQSDWALEFKTGDRVTITRMPLGGYQISPAGNNRSVGARRIQ